MLLSLEQRLLRAEQLCQLHKARLTPVRKALLALIYTHEQHITAYELLRLLRATYPKAESMTVYRALNFLQKQGLVHRIASLSAYTACDAPHHSYVTQLLLCERCGQTQEVNAPELARLLNKMLQAYRFQASNRPLEVVGVCHACCG